MDALVREILILKFLQKASINQSIGKTIFIFLQIFRNFIGCIMLLTIPIPLILYILSKNEDLSYYGIKMKKYLQHTKDIFSGGSDIEKLRNQEFETLVVERVDKIDKIESNSIDLENEEDLNYFNLFKLSIKLKFKELKSKIKNFCNYFTFTYNLYFSQLNLQLRFQHI